MGTKLGFIFSIEALLAAILLFGIFLLTSDISKLDSDYSQNDKILYDYADSTLVVLDKTGALKELFENGNDTKIKNITESLIPSICTQLEIYNYSATPQNLYYSYTSQDCTKSWSTPISSKFSTYVNRTNVSNISVFWVKAVHYAK